MLGTLPQARDGKLVFLCGGERDTFAALEPLLAQLARSVRWVGPSGRGAQLKALINMVMNTNTAALAEAFALGDALGFDPALVRDVLADSAGASRVLENDGPRMLERSYETRLSARHAAKDAGIAVSLAAAAGLDLPLASATQAQYDRMVASGLGEIDKAGVAELTFLNRSPSVSGVEAK
jgi:3-hydroxyisobutyrate dehydrogenase